MSTSRKKVKLATAIATALATAPRENAPATVQSIHGPKRDPKLRPLIGDRFATEDGYVVEIIGMGTRDFAPFFHVRQRPGAKLLAKLAETGAEDFWSIESGVWWEHESGKDLKHLMTTLRVLDPFDPA